MTKKKIKIRLRSIELILKGAKNAFIVQMIPNLFSTHFKQLHPSVVQDMINEAMKMGDKSMVNFYNAMIGREDNVHLLNMAGYPIQWIIGADDNILHYKKILQQCYKSGINFVTFYRDCGHMSMIEAPGKLIDDLKIFIGYSYDHSNRS